MVIPGISRIKLRLTLLEILGQSGWLKKTAGKLADFYLKLGGDPGLRWNEQTDLQEIVVDLEKRVNDMVMARLQPALDKGPMDEEYLSVYVGRPDEEFAIDWQPIVVLRHRSIFAMYTGFLDRMKAEKPEISRLIAEILGVVIAPNILPLWALPDVAEFFEEMYDDGFEEDEEARQTLADIRQEKEAFMARIRKIDFKKVPKTIARLKKSYGKMASGLGEGERAWIENAFDLLTVAGSIGKMNFRNPDEFSLEPASTESFYALMGEAYGTLDEMWEAHVQSLGENCTEPCDIIELSGLEDLENLGRYVETISRLQKLLYDGGSLYVERNDQA